MTDTGQNLKGSLLSGLFNIAKKNENNKPKKEDSN